MATFLRATQVKHASCYSQPLSRLILWQTRHTVVWNSHRSFSVSIPRFTANHYNVLGVHSQASPAEIKAAYFKLSKKYHPDINLEPEASEKFHAVGAAYEVLSNEKQRRIYDVINMKEIIATHQRDGRRGYGDTPGVTKHSYGPHMRYPEYITDNLKNHRVMNRDVNYFSYDRMRKDHYRDFVYDRTASMHNILAHRDALWREEDGVFKNYMSEWAWRFSMIVVMIILFWWFFTMDYAHKEEKEKLNYRLSFGQDRDKNTKQLTWEEHKSSKM